MKMKFRSVPFALFCIVFVCNVCLGGRYHYSAGITNAMPDAQLFLTPFSLYSSSPQLGVPSCNSIEGTKMVDSFIHRPLPLVRLHWEVRRGESVNRYWKDVEIDVPKQFTEKTGAVLFSFFMKRKLWLCTDVLPDTRKNPGSPSGNLIGEPIISSPTVRHIRFRIFRISSNRTPGAALTIFAEVKRGNIKSRMIQSFRMDDFRRWFGCGHAIVRDGILKTRERDEAEIIFGERG